MLLLLYVFIFLAMRYVWDIALARVEPATLALEGDILTLDLRKVPLAPILSTFPSTFAPLLQSAYLGEQSSKTICQLHAESDLWQLQEEQDWAWDNHGSSSNQC